MRIVISGGTGLIGSELAHDLAGESHQVTILSRSPEKYQKLFGENVHLVYWDGRSAGEWVSHVDGADAIVNLAGESISGEGFLPDRWNADKKKRILDSRLKAGQAIVQAIETVDHKPGVLIQASAVGYYGSTGNVIVTESSPPGNDYLASVCEAWESSTISVERLGVRRAVARMGLVLSAEGGALPRLIVPSRLFAGGSFGSGNQYWPWVHITDAVRALRFIIENEVVAGFVNITAPNPVTSKEFGRALGRALGRPSAIPAPAFALRLVLGEVASTILEGQRVLPQILLDEDFTFQFPEIDLALNNLI